MNWLLQDAFATDSFVRQVIGFAGVAFGVFSLSNTLFAPVFVAAPTGILLLNTGVGILCVGGGVWTERVVRQQLSHVSNEEMSSTKNTKEHQAPDMHDLSAQSHAMGCPQRMHRTAGILRHFQAFFYAQAESCSRRESSPALVVELVETHCH